MQAFGIACKLMKPHPSKSNCSNSWNFVQDFGTAGKLLFLKVVCCWELNCYVNLSWGEWKFSPFANFIWRWNFRVKTLQDKSASISNDVSLMALTLSHVITFLLSCVRFCATMGHRWWSRDLVTISRQRHSHTLQPSTGTLRGTLRVGAYIWILKY